MQDFVTTLWAYATVGTRPGVGMMGLLERRAEAISWDFNSQNTATTLCAYVTMGTRPGVGMIELLEGRVEAMSAEFNSQNVAKTLWAFATMRRMPGGGSCGGNIRAVLLAGYCAGAGVVLHRQTSPGLVAGAGEKETLTAPRCSHR